MTHEVMRVFVGYDLEHALFIDGVHVGTEWEEEETPFRISDIDYFLTQMEKVTGQAFRYIGTVVLTRMGLFSMGLTASEVNRWGWSDIERIVSENWEMLTYEK